jgi:hypothetical protein
VRAIAQHRSGEVAQLPRKAGMRVPVVGRIDRRIQLFGQGDGAFEHGAALHADAIQRRLLELFGPGQRLTVEPVARFDGKVVQYTSDLADAPP